MKIVHLIPKSMRQFLKEADDLASVLISLIATYLAPIFEQVKAHVPIDWLNVTADFVSNILPTISGAVLFTIFQRTKVSDIWRTFLVAILLNAYGLEIILQWVKIQPSRGIFFWSAFASFMIIQGVYNLLKSVPAEYTDAIKSGILKKIVNFFKADETTK